MNEISQLYEKPLLIIRFPRVPKELLGDIKTSLPLNCDKDDFIYYCEEYILYSLISTWLIDYDIWFNNLYYKYSPDSYVLLVDYTLGFLFQVKPTSIEEAFQSDLVYEYTMLTDIEYIEEHYDSYYFRIARFYIDYLVNKDRFSLPKEDDIDTIELYYNNIIHSFEAVIWP